MQIFHETFKTSSVHKMQKRKAQLEEKRMAEKNKQNQIKQNTIKGIEQVTNAQNN